MKFRWGLAFAVLLVSAPAFGQGKPKGDADALFKEGRTAYEKKDYVTACDKFEASYSIEPKTGALFNLAFCEEKIGRIDASYRHLEEVIPKLTDERLQLSRDLLAKLEPKMPHVVLRLAPGAPPDTRARDGANGKDITLGQKVVLLPGDHDIVVSAKGRAEAHVRASMTMGSTVELTIAPGAATAGNGDEPGKPSSGGSSGSVRRAVGFAIGGLGVAGFIGAGVTGGLLLAKKSEVDAECPNKQCSPKGLALKQEAESSPLLPANTAMWVIGIAGVATGVVLIATSGLGGDKPKAAVVPVVMPGGGGLFASGSF